MTATQRNAKVVCTLGPACDDRETIRALVDAGMSVARINVSHGRREEWADMIESVQAVDGAVEASVATMLDTQGPEVRTAPTAEPVSLSAGSTVVFAPDATTTASRVGLSSSVAAASPGDRLLLADGRIETVVEAVDGDAVRARVESGGDLAGRTGVNVPGVDLGLGVVTEKDRRDLAFAAEAGVDLVAASFVRNGEDVLAVTEAIEATGADLPVVAKVERAAAVENLASILGVAYGVMVARGDLGVECPMESVPMVQKRVVRRCRAAGAPVITATEMLESMVTGRRPTRAEASDVANAVLDGTDAVMLSAETAVGDHPVRVVEAMDRIVREAERSGEYAELREQRVPDAGAARTEALARSARYLARDVDASAVVVATESGYTARTAAKFRPGVPVVAATPNDRVRRRLALSWGLHAVRADLDAGSVQDVIETVTDVALDAGVVQSGETVVVVSGVLSDVGGADTANTLKVHVAAEALAVGRTVVSGRATGPVARAPDGDLRGVPAGAVLALDAGFDAELTGDTAGLAAIVAADDSTTGYPAIVARELGVPMVCGARLDAAAGARVTVDGERGVIYEGAVGRR